MSKPLGLTMPSSKLSPEQAAAIWRTVHSNLSKFKPDDPQFKQVKAAMAADTSESRMESKTLIASLAWSYVQDCPEMAPGVKSGEELVPALAANFLHEPALGARKQVYAILGLPPPDETGGSVTSRMAAPPK
jgi:hypothetical protein